MESNRSENGGDTMGIVVIGATFVDIKGFPNDVYIPNEETPEEWNMCMVELRET